MLSKKQFDFNLWCKIVNLIKSKIHLTQDGIQEIISLKASMNKGVTSDLLIAFPNIKAVDPGVIDNLINIDPYWLTGFITGDGSFSASSRNTKRKVFRVRFYLTQHSRDLDLLEVIKIYFLGGRMYK